MADHCRVILSKLDEQTDPSPVQPRHETYQGQPILEKGTVSNIVEEEKVMEAAESNSANSDQGTNSFEAPAGSNDSSKSSQQGLSSICERDASSRRPNPANTTEPTDSDVDRESIAGTDLKAEGSHHVGVREDVVDLELGDYAIIPRQMEMFASLGGVATPSCRSPDTESFQRSQPLATVVGYAGQEDFAERSIITQSIDAVKQLAIDEPFRLHEIMTFILGIVFYMEITVKGGYANCWGRQPEEDIFGANVDLEHVMPLKRFKRLS
ncbi:hypothetical protein ON010_g7924 [Phytophthora cinnamomi]|nr:hypothetical protein ON010_g7924 [Phytophthora cinnamomi]